MEYSHRHWENVVVIRNLQVAPLFSYVAIMARYNYCITAQGKFPKKIDFSSSLGAILNSYMPR